MANLAEISERALLDTALAVPGLMLVDFYGDDCVQCVMVAHHLDKMAASLPDALTIHKVYLSGPESAARFGLRGIPTLILFRDGVPVVSCTGALSWQDILDFMQPHLSAGTA